MKNYKIEIEFKVSNNWIQDGFDMTEPERIEQVREFFEEQLIIHAHPGVETKAEIKVEAVEPEIKPEEIVRVKFLFHESNEDLFAFFPNEEFDKNGNKMAYSHIGQHSSCCDEYAEDSRPATPNEYKGLKQELESIGYNLELI